MSPIVLVLVLLLSFTCWRQLLAVMGAATVILIAFGCIYLADLIQQLPT